MCILESGEKIHASTLSFLHRILHNVMSACACFCRRILARQGGGMAFDTAQEGVYSDEVL